MEEATSRGPRESDAQEGEEQQAIEGDCEIQTMLPFPQTSAPCGTTCRTQRGTENQPSLPLHPCSTP